MSSAKQLFAFLLQCVLAFGSSSGCNSHHEQSSGIDGRFIEKQTGLDPSKIYVLSGQISSMIVDKGMKLERTVFQLNITSVDGVTLQTALHHYCNLQSSNVEAGDSGDFFGFLQVSTNGSLEASDYAKAKGIPPFEQLTMNSSDFKFHFEIQILGRVK